jgi:primary-amine oxidase
VRDLFGNGTGGYYPSTGGDPYWQYDNRITEWNQYWGSSTGSFDSYDLLPAGLFYKATYDLYGSDPDSWTFGGWLYNGIYYKTTEEFRAAWSSPGFEKLKPNIDGVWTHTDMKGIIFVNPSQ